MTSVDVDEREAREELADQGYDLVGDVLAPGAAHEQRGLLEPPLRGVLEGEVAEVVEGLAEHAERDAELLRRAAGRPVQVAQQELPDRQLLLVLGQDGVGVGLPRHARRVDPPHPLHVPRERRAEDRVDRRVVDRHQVVDQVRRAEGEGHGGFGAPRMCENLRSSLFPLGGVWAWMGLGGSHGVPDERGALQPVLADEAGDVVGHGEVVVARVVRRFAVVAQILRARRVC